MKNLLCIISLFCTISSLAQYHTIKVFVMDDKGDPIGSATLESKRLKRSFGVNSNGKLSITTPFGYDTLICKHICFENRVEIVYKNDTVNFILNPKATYYKEQLSFVNNLNSKIEDDTALINKWNYEIYYGDSYDKLFTSVMIPANYKCKLDDNQAFINDFKNAYNKNYYEPFKGFVKVRLLIDKEGKIVNSSVIKGINRLIDKQVIETIEQLQNWRPAVTNGVVVSSYVDVEINSF